MGRLASRRFGRAWIVGIAGVRVIARIAVIVLVAAIVGLIAGSCAGPLLHTSGRGGRDRDTETMSSGDAVLMIGVVVDTIGSAGTLVVKDVQDHGTWTVAIGPGTRIYGIEGGMTRVSGIEIGQRVQIRGNSRVPSIIEADEIEVERTPIPPSGLPMPGTLPR